MKKVIIIIFSILILVLCCTIKLDNKSITKLKTNNEPIAETTTKNINMPEKSVNILGTWRIEKIALKSVYLKNREETDSEYIGKKIEFAENYIKWENNVFENLQYHYYKNSIEDFNFKNKYSRTVLGEKPYVEKVDNLYNLIQKDNIKVKYIDDFNSTLAFSIINNSDDNSLPNIFQNFVVLNDCTMINDNSSIIFLLKKE